MIVGVPREIKADEYRVALLPVGAEELTTAGQTVLVEAGAGQGRGSLLAWGRGAAPAGGAVPGRGVVGPNAAKVAASVGANARIVGANIDRLRYRDDIMPPDVTTLYSDRHMILETIERADLVI